MAKLVFEFTEEEMINALVQALGDKLPTGYYVLSADAMSIKRGHKGFKVILYAEPITK